MASSTGAINSSQRVIKFFNPFIILSGVPFNGTLMESIKVSVWLCGAITTFRGESKGAFLYIANHCASASVKFLHKPRTAFLLCALSTAAINSETANLFHQWTGIPKYWRCFGNQFRNLILQPKYYPPK